MSLSNIQYDTAATRIHTLITDGLEIRGYKQDRSEIFHFNKLLLVHILIFFFFYNQSM